MIHLKNEEYENLLRQIDEKTECIALYAKERNEQRLRADRAEKRWSELKDFLLRYEKVPQSVQSFETVFEYMKEVERLEERGLVD